MTTHSPLAIELHSGTVIFPHKLQNLPNPLGERPCFLLTHSMAFHDALELNGKAVRLAMQPMDTQTGQSFLLIFMQIRDVLGVTIANLAEPAVLACLEAAIDEQSLTLHINARWGSPTISLPLECPSEYLHAWLAHGKSLPRLPYDARLADLIRSIEWLKGHAVELELPIGKNVPHLSICGVITSRKD
ncbi:hypothetical protein [Dechloromonas agitata]|uniref:hypothetical protein n=1 Tax=Dechloromonas agitata TaxID=73030 RepID=UPI00047FED91|nr:hypothetical protein [Dechloromonas agitata]